jgi:uncharacterized protein (TIGR03792 family)
VGAALPKSLAVKLGGMTVEWLNYHISSEMIDTFLKADAEIWTTMLSQQPGFISKQTWLNPDRPNEINFVICWKTRTHWKAIPKTLLQETDKKFVEAVGRFELQGVLEYTVL